MSNDRQEIAALELLGELTRTSIAEQREASLRLERLSSEHRALMARTVDHGTTLDEIDILLRRSNGHSLLTRVTQSEESVAGLIQRFNEYDAEDRDERLARINGRFKLWGAVLGGGGIVTAVLVALATLFGSAGGGMSEAEVTVAIEHAQEATEEREQMIMETLDTMRGEQRETGDKVRAIKEKIESLPGMP
jgi:hypothetical protein